jgi:hypothetical protein
VAIRLTVEVDEDRLRGAGKDAGEDAIMAQLDALQDGRISLQTRDAWLPVRMVKIRQRLEPVPRPPAAAGEAPPARRRDGPDITLPWR